MSSGVKTMHCIYSTVYSPRDERTFDNVSFVPVRLWEKQGRLHYWCVCIPREALERLVRNRWSSR